MIKQTYFSHSYNLTKTVQQHFVEELKSDFYKNWNGFYTKLNSENQQKVKINLKSSLISKK